MRRNVGMVGTAVCIHVAALWALQAGLSLRNTRLLESAFVLVSTASTDAMTPIQPAPVPELVKPNATDVPTLRLATPAQPTPPTQPAPAATVTPAAPPHTETLANLAPAPAGSPTRTEPAASANSQHSAATTMPGATPVALTPLPGRLELPTSNADYLNNPKPPYPPTSRRLGEQGQVIVRILIGVEGVAQQASIKQSSGFERLDQAALTTARQWRYVPGKRGGVPEPMWFNVPFNFVLE